MKITWGVGGSETLGNVTTTSYRLSPFQVEVIDLKDPNSEVKVTLRNKLKVQNLSNGIWQLGITKQYLVPLVRSGNIYQGSLDDDGIAVTDEAGGSELPMNSSLRPILMEHSQQLHWESTGQELQLLVNGKAQTFDGQAGQSLLELHFETMKK